MKTIARTGTVTAVGPSSVRIEFYDEPQGPAQTFEISATENEQREWAALLHAERAATLMLMMSKPSPTWGVDLASATDEQLSEELKRRDAGRNVEEQRRWRAMRST